MATGINSLQWARAIISELYGEAETATARERKGGDAMINNGIPHTLGAGAKAHSAEPCERLLAASLGGRAAWGRPGGFSRSCGKARSGAALRGHARDDTSRIGNSFDPVWMFVKKGTNFDQ